MNHRWDFELELGYAHCTRCGMRRKTYEVKRGGLPRCNPPPEPLPPTPVCLATDLLPVLSCFNCEGKLDDKLCVKMRRNYTDLLHVEVESEQTLSELEGRGMSKWDPKKKRSQ